MAEFRNIYSSMSRNENEMNYQQQIESVLPTPVPI